MAEVRVRGAAKQFGPLTVLTGVDLDVPAGRTVALVGPSGCGKTTLLRLIAGFETLDAGQIQIGGQTVSGDAWVPAHRRGVGYLPQDGALFPHLTVAGNVAFGLARGEDRRARVAELLTMVSLDPSSAERRPDQLSGGQQQRVALARALGARPRVLLLDEPFSALDSSLRDATRRAVRALLDDLRITTILVTHDMAEAREFADVVVAIQGGRAHPLETGTPGT